MKYTKSNIEVRKDRLHIWSSMTYDKIFLEKENINMKFELFNSVLNYNIENKIADYSCCIVAS